MLTVLRVSIDSKWPLNGQKVRIQLLSDSHEKGENLFPYFPVQKRNIRRGQRVYCTSCKLPRDEFCAAAAKKMGEEELGL